ncbi:MAG: 16S rRNA (cytidine(1402)-2'-O)-methyltransferase [Candidatus Marinimicrobia bacterium]|nr:16S rRNA (cytidine(1402)-2'-O)-methyltransferase [Candidatus Neomarinimicrobiota bacterium]
MAQGTLYIVGTPIGNLEDITFRAVNTLKSVDVIACEDTRVTRILLNKYGIKGKKILSHHQYNEKNSISGLLKLLEEGLNVAFVSDAGTPAISDPGNNLVQHAVQAGIPVIPIPGPSAVTTLLSICHFPVDIYTFEGFLPHKKGRQTRLNDIANRQHPTVLFESTHRIVRLLEELFTVCGDRELFIGRELTKIHETLFRGKISEARKWVQKASIKGEFALIIAPKEKDE